VLFLLLAIALLPPLGEPLRDQCDVAEVEAVYSDEGCLQLTQLILWSGDLDGVPVVRDWRIVKPDFFDFGRRPGDFRDGDAFREVRYRLFRRISQFRR
jgi:hypothetical protein